MMTASRPGEPTPAERYVTVPKLLTPVTYCTACGCVVYDETQHERWHARGKVARR